MTKSLGLGGLSALFKRAEGPEGFEHLAETLERIMQLLDTPELNAHFRADIYELLLTSVELSAQLAERTYDSKSATSLGSRIHEVVARINVHLANRPTNQAFGILFPRTSTLHSDIFASEGEAQAKLVELARIGLREVGEVVPVSIISGRLAQPKAPPIPETDRVVELTSKIEKASK